MIRIKRPILPHEVIHTFNSKNKRVQFRTDQKLVLKVYDKKARKYVGAFNIFKKDEPVPRLFGRVQKKLYEIQHTPAWVRAPLKGSSFKVKTSKLIKHQIPTRVLNEIRKQSKLGRAFQIKMEVSFGSKKPRLTMVSNPAWSLGKRFSNDDLRKIFTVESLKLAGARSARFSNKLLTRKSNESKKQIRSAEISVSYIDIKDLGGSNAKKVRRRKKKDKNVVRRKKRNKGNKKTVK